MYYRTISWILSLLLLSFSFTTLADNHFRLLEDADKLTDITPSRSLELAEQFLETRQLVTETNAQGMKTMTREETDNTLRTPRSTIEALRIIAESKITLGDLNGAQHSIEQAELLAEKSQLYSTRLALTILKIKVIWQLNEDRQLVDRLIDQVIDDLAASALDPLALAQLNYQLLITRAEVASSMTLVEAADKFFEQAESYLAKTGSARLEIDFALIQGRHNITYQRYNRALYSLLAAYWSAVEHDLPDLLAKTNRLLGQLYQTRKVHDKALDHLSQAADFYDNYGNSVVLSDVLNEMANLYYVQGSYNLALVHYFNVLDGESAQYDLSKIIELRLNLAKTYLQLYNVPLAEQYVRQAGALLTFSQYDDLKAWSFLLQAQLNIQIGEYQSATDLAHAALSQSKAINHSGYEQQAHDLLSTIYEQRKQFELAYQHTKQYRKLERLKQSQQKQITEDEFTQQQQFIEQSIHYDSLGDKMAASERERARFQLSATVMFVLSALLLFLFLRRGWQNEKMKAELTDLYKDHYTHPRSGLRNLRLLNVKLPSSLEQSSANFEQWHTGDLIHEPLHDKLRFVMVDLPFLRTTYLRSGYKAGLELERKFGEYIKPKIESPARLYHFSDAMFLFVIPNTDPDKTAQQLFEQVNSWVTEFNPEQNIERNIRAGIADYPFLPRAYTAINDKELIDILLLALNMARKLSLAQGDSHWVCLQAIEHAPAASFAGDDIRSACKQAVAKGLIKIQSSGKTEDDIINIDSAD